MYHIILNDSQVFLSLSLRLSLMYCIVLYCMFTVLAFFFFACSNFNKTPEFNSTISSVNRQWSTVNGQWPVQLPRFLGAGAGGPSGVTYAYYVLVIVIVVRVRWKLWDVM